MIFFLLFRYKVLDGRIPEGTSNDDVTICLMAKSSSGRIRRWRQNQCHQVSEFSRAGGNLMAWSVTSLLVMALMASSSTWRKP